MSRERGELIAGRTRVSKSSGFFRFQFPTTRLLRATGVALLCVVGTALPRNAQACVPSSVTGASLQIAGDDMYDVYVNGTWLYSCGGGPPKACEKAVTVPIPVGLINLPPADNVMSMYVTDTGGSRSGVTWQVTLTYSDCPTQTIQSDGFCTRSIYAGNINDGTTNFPPGWENLSYDDSSWVGVFTDPGSWSVNFGPDYLWGESGFGAVQGDGYMFRQYFEAGNASYCPLPPVPTPTPIGAAADTPTPGPPGCGAATTLSAVAGTGGTTWDGISDAGIINPGFADTDGGGVASTSKGDRYWWEITDPSTSGTITQVEICADWDGGQSTIDMEFDFSVDGSTTGLLVPDTNIQRAPGWDINCVDVTADVASWTSTEITNLRIFLRNNNGSGPSGIDIDHVFARVTYEDPSCSSPTHTRTFTTTPTFTSSFTRTQTPTWTPTFTWTSTYTHTSTPTHTATSTNTVTPTPTFTPSATFTWTPTWTSTHTWTSTYTHTPTYTSPPSGTPTSTWTPTFTVSYTPTTTATYTNSPTHTLTYSNSLTYSTTPTPTISATSTYTSTDTPTRTHTATYSPGDTSTLTLTITPTRTHTVTYSPLDTHTITFSITPTETPSDTPTESETATPTFTQSETLTSSETLTFSATSTLTFTASETLTDSPTWTSTATTTWTPTFSPTYTWTPTWTPTFSASNTLTVTPTVTPTYTPTSTWTMTGTALPTLTSTPTFTPSPAVTPLLDVVISSSKSTVYSGDPFAVTVHIENLTAGLANPVTLKLTIPPGMTVEDTGGGTISGNEIHWVISALAGGASLDKTILLGADKGTEGTELEILAEIEYGNVALSLSGLTDTDEIMIYVSQPPFFEVDRNAFSGPPQRIRIRFASALESPATLTVYNSAGELIKRIGVWTVDAGVENRQYWDGTNQNGEIVASGIYLIRLEVRDLSHTRRVAVIR